MKSPIKAQIITYNQSGKETKRRKSVGCHFAKGETPKLIEVYLTGEGDEMQSVYIDYKSLMRELSK